MTIQTQNLGIVLDDSLLVIQFATVDPATGASVTITGFDETNIKIFKDGQPTARASASGYTLLDTDGIDFAGITGVHGFSLALSDDDDPGFYAYGSSYAVVLEGITVAGETVNALVAIFAIGFSSQDMETSIGVILSSVGGLPSALDVAETVLDMSDGIEAGLTLRQAMRGIAAALFGKVSAAGTTTETVRNAIADDADRLVYTVDASGNRTAVATNL